MVQSIRNRDEAISAVLVLDTSGSMTGRPFEAALRAAVRIIESKWPQDQIAIIAISDNKDESSAISRSGLMGRISNLRIPVPIYSLAYTKAPAEYLKNLQALSKNSFGKYFDIGETYGQMIRSVEEIQNILQNDYVLTFRSYVPVDGDEHLLKVGIEYPSRSGKFRYEAARFEAIEPPPLSKVLALQERLDKILAALPDGNPYLTNPFVSKLPGGAARAKAK